MHISDILLGGGGSGLRLLTSYIRKELNLSHVIKNIIPFAKLCEDIRREWSGGGGDWKKSAIFAIFAGVH